MFERGDKVAVLDEDLEGKVLRVNAGEVEIETSEGFLLIFPAEQLVKIGGALPHILPDDVKDLNEVIQQKEASKKRKSVRVKPRERNQPPMEVDLHIG